MADYLKLDQDGDTAILTLNRPEKLNAFAGSLREDLCAAFRNLGESDTVRTIVITGAGRAFCAGGDVNYMHELAGRRDVVDFSRILDAANAAALALHHCPKLTIAAVNGVAAGGGANLALGCDFRIGTPTASFVQSFVHIGLGPDWGGSYLLPRIVGPDRARELILSGRRVEATEGLALGLLHELVPAEQLMTRVLELARTVGGRSRHAITAIKRAITQFGAGDFALALEAERSAQIRCFLTPEAGAAFTGFVGRNAGEAKAT